MQCFEFKKKPAKHLQRETSATCYFLLQALRLIFSSKIHNLILDHDKNCIKISSQYQIFSGKVPKTFANTHLSRNTMPQAHHQHMFRHRVLKHVIIPKDYDQQLTKILLQGSLFSLFLYLIYLHTNLIKKIITESLQT